MNTLFYNGIIRSFDDDKVYSCIGIKGEKISFVGNSIDKIENQYDNTVDLNGKLMLPGFTDSHLHLVNYSFVENSVKLFNCSSVEEALDRAKEYYHKNKSNVKWLYCRGWKESLFTHKRYPKKEELDSISENIPIIFVRICGHIAVLNSVGLEKLKSLDVFDEIKNEVDFESGVIKENAVQFFYEALDKPMQSFVENIMCQGMKKLNSVGITSVQSDDFSSLPGKDWQLIINSYNSLQMKGKMTVRVYQQCLFEQRNEYEKFLERGYRSGQGNDFYKLGPLKILCDGCLGARTAALEQSYSDSDTRGIAVWQQDELYKIIEKAFIYDMPIAAHCIGDRAMKTVLDCIDRAYKTLGKIPERNGLVHVQIASDEVFERMKQQQMMAFIQPIFVDMDMDIVEERVGKERMKTSYAWKTMQDKGIKLLGSSDAPCAGFDILENIYTAVTRKNLRGEGDGWLKEQCLSVDEAAKMFTCNPPFAEFNENIKGVLKVGNLADMVILSDDIYKIDSEKIKDVEVLQTIVGGKTVFMG